MPKAVVKITSFVQKLCFKNLAILTRSDVKCAKDVYGMEAERCQVMAAIFKSINVFEIGLYFLNPFIFFKSVSIISNSNYLCQMELYFSNQFIFFKSVDIYKFQIYLDFSNRFIFLKSIYIF